MLSSAPARRLLATLLVSLFAPCASEQAPFAPCASDEHDLRKELKSLREVLQNVREQLARTVADVEAIRANIMLEHDSTPNVGRQLQSSAGAADVNNAVAELVFGSVGGRVKFGQTDDAPVIMGNATAIAVESERLTISGALHADILEGALARPAPGAQLRVSGTCTVGSSIQSIGANGSVTCEAVGNGPPGPPGTDGAQGPAGTDGAQGPAGPATGAVTGLCHMEGMRDAAAFRPGGAWLQCFASGNAVCTEISSNGRWGEKSWRCACGPGSSLQTGTAPGGMHNYNNFPTQPGYICLKNGFASA